MTRPPRPAELERIVALYEGELDHYRQNPQAAAKMAGEVAGGAEAAELAAWTVVGNVLLNLDETLTKM